MSGGDGPDVSEMYANAVASLDGARAELVRSWEAAGAPEESALPEAATEFMHTLAWAKRERVESVLAWARAKGRCIALAPLAEAPDRAPAWRPFLEAARLLCKAYDAELPHKTVAEDLIPTAPPAAPAELEQALHQLGAMLNTIDPVTGRLRTSM